jgi:hypothetical protein
MSKFVGTGPSSYKIRNFRTADSQKLRTIVLEAVIGPCLHIYVLVFKEVSSFLVSTKILSALIVSVMYSTCHANHFFLVW